MATESPPPPVHQRAQGAFRSKSQNRIVPTTTPVAKQDADQEMFSKLFVGKLNCLPAQQRHRDAPQDRDAQPLGPSPRSP